MSVTKLVFLVAALCAAFWFGADWQKGREAIELNAANKLLKEKAAEADKTAIAHAEAVELINAQLGSTRAQLNRLTTGRPCLSGAAVRVLNAAGAVVPATARQPASAPEASATDRDIGAALAGCRAEHDKLAGQLNAIIDIEDARLPTGR